MLFCGLQYVRCLRLGFRFCEPRQTGYTAIGAGEQSSARPGALR